MTKLNTESMTFRYQNLARRALVKHFKNHEMTQGLPRDERFALYAKMDEDITKEAFRLLKETGGEIEDKFDDAAINVISKL